MFRCPVAATRSPRTGRIPGVSDDDLSAAAAGIAVASDADQLVAACVRAHSVAGAITATRIPLADGVQYQYYGLWMWPLAAVVWAGAVAG